MGIITRIVIFILPLTASACISIKNYRKEALTIQSVHVFRDFNTEGLGASYYARHHINKEFDIINIDAAARLRLEQVFKQSKRTPRLGILPAVAATCNIVFSNRVDSNNSTIFILPNSNGFYNLYDFTTGVDYIVSDTADGKWMMAFIEKLKTM